jgi:hypothetical protein
MELTIEDAEAFVEQLRWQQVAATPAGPLNKPPDPHEYSIREWCGLDLMDTFASFGRLIKVEGYRGRYTPPYSGRVQHNSYLRIGEYVYWLIPPRMLNRTPADTIQHEPLTEQGSPVTEGSHEP